MKFRRVTKPKPTQWFKNFNCPADFEASGVRYCEPMLAKEIEGESEQDKEFKKSSNYVEEKFDGTRGIMQFFDNDVTKLVTVPQRGYTRIFSRRISKKTNWFCENSDSLPHLKGINVPELAGTILDGEMFIDGRPFKDVAAIMNCTWDKAIERQKMLGKVSFHVFDILRYKGLNCEKFPLHKRKQYLQKAVDAINNPNVIMVKYYEEDDIPTKVTVTQYKTLRDNCEKYPELWKIVHKAMPLSESSLSSLKPENWTNCHLTKKAYYEYIVLNGGEGVILKDKEGKYYHKRGREYSKVKKFLTREVLIMGYAPPTREYNGIFPKDRWLYWVDKHDKKVPIEDVEEESAKVLSKNYTPVSKFYYYDQIGTIEYGVIVEPDDVKSLPSNKGPFEIRRCNFFEDGKKRDVLNVGECSGFDEATRLYITEHQEELMGSVIEVKANEIFRDTGKLRHPRFIRDRADKNREACTWKDHVGA